MVTIRYSKLKTGKFSIYLDYKTIKHSGKEKRVREYLRLYVSRDYSNGKRIVKEDRETMELARQARSKREMEHFGELPVESTGISNLTIQEFIKNEPKYKDSQSIISLIKKLTTFSGTPNLLLSSITYNFLEGFFLYLEGYLARPTAVYHMGQLKTILRWAQKKGAISSHPFTAYKIPVAGRTKKTYFVLEEIKKLSETFVEGESQIRDAFLFSCFTGLRISDIRQIKWEDIKEENKTTKTLVIYPEKTDTTSGNLLRLPLSEQAIKILSGLQGKRKGDKIFNELPSSYIIGNYIKKWAKKADIKKRMHFHAARHTFATMCLTSGIDIYTVSKILGHSTVEHTEIYAQLLDNRLINEISKYPQLMKNFKK